jgi:arylsulfatase A-like enzyme
MASAFSGCTAPTAERPNVLLITVDTLRADHLSGYGYDRPTSPNLDAFFETAILFTDANSNSGWTLPSLASLMTSLHPVSHGCVKFDSQLAAEHLTLAEILRADGYRTHGIGSHTFLRESRGLQQGFASYDDELVERHERTAEHVSSALISDKAIGWLENEAAGAHDEAWLLWLHYFDPHTTYVEHPEISAVFGNERPVDLYDGEIAFTDREIARVLAHLAKSGDAASTIVVLTADHGEALGEHGSNRHSTNLFREVTRIPLAIRAPQFAPRRVDQPVESLDILPTLIELLDLTVDTRPAGRSLVPAMRGEVLPSRPILAQTEMSEHYTADSLILGRWKLVVDRSGALQRSAEGEIVLKPREMARGEPDHYLFDRMADPADRIDVKQRLPAVANDLRTRLSDMLEWATPPDGSPDRQALSAAESEALRALGYLE